jgi:hypothetical protein
MYGEMERMVKKLSPVSREATPRYSPENTEEMFSFLVSEVVCIVV